MGTTHLFKCRRFLLSAAGWCGRSWQLGAAKFRWSCEAGRERLCPHLVAPTHLVASCIRVAHIPPTILWAMMQRGKHEWTKQITEIIDNKQIAMGLKVRATHSWISPRPLHPTLYGQKDSKANWEQKRLAAKKHMSTIHQAVNCALLCGWDTALWGHLSTMNPITVVCTIGQSVWNHRLHLRTRA